MGDIIVVDKKQEEVRNAVGNPDRQGRQRARYPIVHRIIEIQYKEKENQN